MKCVQVIDNPDAVSEQALLRAYAPSLSQDILDSLTGAFAELRQLNEAGLIAYPCVLLLCVRAPALECALCCASCSCVCAYARA